MIKPQATGTSNMRHSRRIRTAGTALALTAVATVGGVAVAAPASAATVRGQVPATTSGFPTDLYGATHDLATALCKDNFPGSRPEWTGKWSSGNGSTVVTWNCVS